MDMDKEHCRYCKNDTRITTMCEECATLVFKIKNYALYQPNEVLALLTDQARQIGFHLDLVASAKKIHKGENSESVQQDKHNDSEEPA